MRQILSLNFRDRGRQHLRLKSCFRVQTETFPWSSSPRTASTLLCLSLRDRGDNQRIHAKFWIISVLLDETRVDNIIDMVNRNGCFRNICSNDNFSTARRCWVKDSALHLTG